MTVDLRLRVTARLLLALSPVALAAAAASPTSSGATTSTSTESAEPFRRAWLDEQGTQAQQCARERRSQEAKPTLDQAEGHWALAAAPTLDARRHVAYTPRPRAPRNGATRAAGR